MTVRILTVCTGNVCRSPLAASLMRSRLAEAAVVRSAGTRALVGEPMTAGTVRVAEARDVPPSDVATHRAQQLTEPLIDGADLVLAMAREHRRHAVELVPARLRSTFTVRELARLSRGVPDDEITAEAASATESRQRLQRALAFIASRRHEVELPTNLADDDVIDPYGGPFESYERSAAQLLPAVDEVTRVIRAALRGVPGTR